MPQKDDMPRTRRDRRRCGRAALAICAGLAVLLALGAWLRFTGIDFLLPQHPEPDGAVIVYQLDAHEGRVADPKGHEYWGFYPHLLSQAARAWPSSAESPLGADASLAEHLTAARSSQTRARRTVALASLLVVPATFFLARRFLSGAWSAIAAAFCASSFLHAWFAQQSRPHAVATALDTFVLLAACGMVASPSAWTWALAPLALGLATACLQSGIATGIAILAAVLLVRERPARLWLGLGAGAAAGLALALAFYPASTNPESANAPLIGWDPKYGTLLLKGHQVFVGLFDGDGLPVVTRALWDYEPLLVSVALVGVVLALVRRWNHLPVLRDEKVDELKVVLTFGIAYFVVIALYERSYQRFVLPLVPLFAILAAWTLSLGARRARVASRFGALAFAAPLLAAETFATWRLVELRAKPDTLTQAAEWVRTHAEPTQTFVMLPGIDVPLATTDASRARDADYYNVLGYPWRVWNTRIGERGLPEPRFSIALMPLGGRDLRAIRQDAAAYARSLTADFAIVEAYENYWRSPILKNIYDGIVLRGERVARFSPDGERENGGYPLSYQDDGIDEHFHWLTRTLRAEAVGPVVEIFRLR